MSSAGIRRTGQGVCRGERRRGSEGQVPEFWPQPTSLSQTAGGWQLGGRVGRGEGEKRKVKDSGEKERR